MSMSRRTFLVSSAAALAYVSNLRLPRAKAKSKEVDLGSTEGTLPFGQYTVTATIEFAHAPTESELIEFYWGPHGAKPINAQFIGGMWSLTDQVVSGYIGSLSPGCEEGQLIMVNNTSQAMKASVDLVQLNDDVDVGERTISHTYGEPISFVKDEIT